MIDLTIHHENLAHNIRKARENRVVIPTYRQMKHPETIPGVIRDRLKAVGLWDVDPLNLFRITWKNEAKETGRALSGRAQLHRAPPLSHRRPRPHRVAWWESGFPPAAIRWEPPTAVWCPVWSQVSSTPPQITLSGRPPATTAGAGAFIPSCWRWTRLPSSPRA